MGNLNPNYTRYSTDRILIVGTLSSDGLKMTYTDSEGTQHQNVTLASLLNSFKGIDIELSVMTQYSGSKEGSAYPPIVGSPLNAPTAASMTETDKIYVYTGSESGYTNGHWYYYNPANSRWTDGGVYNGNAST